MKDNKLLNIIRERRKYETRTLDSYMPTYELTGFWFEKQQYDFFTKEMEIEMKTIGGQNKTKMLKEMRDAGITKGSFEERKMQYKKLKRITPQP